MENKDIILFILVICVIYLLYCNGNKESFATDTSSATSNTTSDAANNEPDERIVRLIERKFTQLSNENITESIKNLGIIAKKIQQKGDFTFPANLNVSSDLNVTGKLNLLPEGTVVMWTKSEIPDGWVKCDGKNNTPDLRGRFVLGEGNKRGDGLTSRTLNQTGGAETHTLTVEEMPKHTHTYSHVYFDGGAHIDYGNDMKQKNEASGEAGGGQEHNNMPPFWVLIYIMKVY